MDDVDVILVDDHVVVREGLSQLLLTFKGVSVVGEAGDGYEAIGLAEQLQPDIVILDISMPKMRGIEAIKEIKRVAPDCKILVLSMFGNEEYIRQSLKNGASGYMLKDAASSELKSAITYIQRGDVYLSPSISRTIVDNWLDGVVRRPFEGIKSPLSSRELEVLKLLAEGWSNKEVAEFLHISIKTVETHRHRIMDKLKLKNITDLVKYALRTKLIELK
jgi:two-component system response regulator NreC